MRGPQPSLVHVTLTCILTWLFLFIRQFEKRDVLWEHLRRAGGWAGGMAASTGFPPSKSKSFQQVFIKLSKYVGVHNVSTKFYNQPTPRHSEIMAL